MTGLLVRAPQSEWRKNSLIAVDAGAHLASIMRILQQHMPHSSEAIPESGYSKQLEEGPFAGIRFPHFSARNNALYIFRDLLHSFLITHPHLDHISGMGINTPALEYGREAKAIVALPPTIEAIKTHIFNDSIWPNLSDEAHGVGLVTYRRLIEGGNPRLGSGEARGYVSVCDGLATKCWSVSHGKCQRRHHGMGHQRVDSGGWFANDFAFPSRRLSRLSDDHGYFAAMAQQQAYSNAAALAGSQTQITSGPPTPGASMMSGGGLGMDNAFEPVTSSAFFIRNEATGEEILIFGDIEPDSVSMSPRNHVVWDDAAPKIASGKLKAIFIECSFDDSTRDQDLYGHLCPRHLFAELKFLASRVMVHRDRKVEDAHQIGIVSLQDSPINIRDPPSQAELLKKRKRAINGDPETSELEPSPKVRPVDSTNMSQYVGRRSTSRSGRRLSTPSKTPRHVQFHNNQGFSLPQSDSTSDRMLGPQPNAVQAQSESDSTQLGASEKLASPLKGLTVHIIHVKDTMLDGPSAGQIILGQLRSHASATNLGCEFDVTECGESIWI